MRFLVVDDHHLMRNALRQLIGTEFPGADVVEACDAASAMKVLPGKQWSAVILDIDLPDRSGLDLLSDIFDLSRDARVLVLSGHTEHDFGIRALRSGAAGYISKAAPAGEIRSALKLVVAGRTYISPTIAAEMLNELRSDGRALHEMLSDREFEVLRLFGSGCNSSAVAERLNISVKTVSTYRTRIPEKLHLRTTGEIVRYAVEHKL